MAASTLATGLREGRPLDPATRSYFEPRFGADFSQVRVHDDGDAHRAAAGLDAKAFTVGHNIAFAAGQHVPGSQEGRRLLAHELTHVVQQAGARPSVQMLRGPGLPISTPSDAGEREAERVAAQVAAGGTVQIGERVIAPLVQREPTKPRAATGSAVIADLGTHTGPSTLGKLTAGRVARQEWESVFSRHFSEPDVTIGGNEAESKHPRYLYSRLYGWIDGMHFFAHIQYAEDKGLQGATDQGIKIERSQQILRNQVAPGASDPLGYTALLEADLMDPAALDHYREDLVMLVQAGSGFVMDAQMKALTKGFTDEQWAKLTLDNAYSAFSYEDLVSNQLGVQWFRLHGAYVNAGTSDADVRSRFIARIEQFFTDIQVVDDPKTITSKASSLPLKERWTAAKKTLDQIKAKHPELFQFNADFRLRIAVYDTRGLAEQHQKNLAGALPSRAPATTVAPYGPTRWALYMQPLARFDAVVWKAAVDRAVSTGSGGALIEPMP